jgi:hypothetical protein
MSALISSKPLPVSDIEDCVPQPAIGSSKHTGQGTASATKDRMQTIEEEDSSHMNPDFLSGSDSSSASSVHEQEPRNEVPKEVLEYVERIREAIQAQGDRALRQRLAHEKADAHVGVNPPWVGERKRAASLSILTEKAKTAMTKLTVSRKRVTTLIGVKPKAKPRVDMAEIDNKGSVLIGATKVGKIQYIHEDKNEKKIPFSVACESGLESGGEKSLTSSAVENDEDDGNHLLTKEKAAHTNRGPKYDLRTGRRLGDSRSPKERFRHIAIMAHRSAVNGIQALKEQASATVNQRQGKSAEWSKID